MDRWREGEIGRLIDTWRAMRACPSFHFAALCMSRSVHRRGRGRQCRHASTPPRKNRVHGHTCTGYACRRFHGPVVLRRSAASTRAALESSTAVFRRLPCLETRYIVKRAADAYPGGFWGVGGGNGNDGTAQTAPDLPCAQHHLTASASTRTRAVALSHRYSRN